MTEKLTREDLTAAWQAAKDRAREGAPLWTVRGTEQLLARVASWRELSGARDAVRSGRERLGE